jgi:hypothetical protein
MADQVLLYKSRIEGAIKILERSIQEDFKELSSTMKKYLDGGSFSPDISEEELITMLKMAHLGGQKEMLESILGSMR